MDRAEFLEFTLGSRSDVIIETWDLKAGKPTRVTLPFDKAARFSAEEAFWLPENGSILSLVSDSDDRDPVLPPSVKVETSLSRFNSYWRFAEALSRKECEVLLGYLDPLSPPRMTQTFRLPGTTSMKHGQPFTCRITDASGHIYHAAQVFGLALPSTTVPSVDPAWLREPGPFEMGNTKQALMWLHKKSSDLKSIGKSTRSLLEKKDFDPRALMIRLIKGGLSEKEAIWCAEAAVCNPYRHWLYGAREELAKLLLIKRAQSGETSISATIHGIRSSKSDHSKPFVIRDKMAKRALEDFEENTSVLQATDGTRWAVDRHSGNAMELIEGSEGINHYIMRRYGINPVDIDHRHLLKEIILLAASKPATTEATAISFYDKQASRMMISFGGREVAVLTSEGMNLQENGAGGVIFKPVPRADPLATKLLPVDRALDGTPGAWWDKILPLAHLGNLTRGDPEEVSALLHVWTIFFLFRNIAASRPLLMFLGAMGSGKTTLNKKLHLLLYGNGVKLFEVKSQDWWTTTVSNYPLALFDNVDTPTPWWLPPALALAITPTDATKRSLYSNNTPYTMRMDAMIGLSSHDAAFLKEDVIDRAVLIQSRRIEDNERLEETPMMDAILRDREELLAGLLADVVRVLGTPRPAAVRGSAIRIVDFNAIGRWIARGIGKEDVFSSAIGTLSVHQKAKVLEEDISLVLALEDMQRISPLANEWCTHTQIWSELISLADDNGEALRGQYKNGQIFGRKLLAIYTQLRDTIGIVMKDDPEKGWQVFKIGTPIKGRKESI